MQRVPQKGTRQMKKHKFNIFPEAKPEDYGRLLEDIRQNGYDKKQPVTLFEGDILDGWNRYRACTEIGIDPPTVAFYGSSSEAIAFVMRTNKRRNLNSGQWATIAADADDLLAAIAEQVEKEKARKVSEARRGEVTQKIVQPRQEQESAHKAAEIFNTNRTYVNNAVKMKKAAPEVFEKVKAGTMTMQDGMKAVRAIPTNPWMKDEEERKAEVESGLAVVANAERDKNLIQWAEKKGIAVRVDRSSKYGNPFVLDEDGGRDEVCEKYERHYLPHKQSITGKIALLRGKVLVCHCYPNRCHADSLKTLANRE